MDFNAIEENDGVRMTWNIWPNSRLEATKCVIPFAACYTPNKKLPNMPVSEKQPWQGSAEQQLVFTGSQMRGIERAAVARDGYCSYAPGKDPDREDTAFIVAASLPPYAAQQQQKQPGSLDGAANLGTP
jgi:hypothetical protein